MGKRDKRKRRKKDAEKGARRRADRDRGPAPRKLEPPPVRLEPAGDYRYRVRKSGAMRVHGLIYGDEAILRAVQRDQGAQQVANVATLPGIVGQAIAMPDIHWGYGFPIGGVAAFDADAGVVSPGGIGYDINCGVRLLATDLDAGEIGPRLTDVIDAMHAALPAGLGRSRRGSTLDDDGLDRVLAGGARAAVEMGYGALEDLEHLEESGVIDGADPAQVSDKARARGAGQLGTLGSGNHFVEVQRVDRVLAEDSAAAFGLHRGQLVVMIHTGSRGLGHQVCTDAVHIMGRAAREADIALPDRQLACAPLGTAAARSYLAAMAGAANFAFANRQVLAHLAMGAIARALGVSRDALAGRVVYDVCHNIAKFERHRVKGAERRLLVHRKGATRALGPGDDRLPPLLRNAGQPVIVPGDMGRASWVLVGTEQAGEESFSSSCHGAGRRLSRSEALRVAKGRDLTSELAKAGIIARAASRKTMLEEMPEAYKDVDRVVDVIEGAGLCRPVARLVPLGVIKG